MRFPAALTYFFRGFRNLNATVIAAIGAVSGVILWLFGPDDKLGISAPVFLGLVFGTVWLVTVLTSALIAAAADAQGNHPRVKEWIEPAGLHSGYQAVYLVEEAEAFAAGDLVAFFQLVGDVEHCLGTGEVVLVQSNGLVQVGLDEVVAGMEGYVDKLRDSAGKASKEILVKKTVPRKVRPAVPQTKAGSVAAVAKTIARVGASDV